MKLCKIVCMTVFFTTMNSLIAEAILIANAKDYKSWNTETVFKTMDAKTQIFADNSLYRFAIHGDLLIYRKTQNGIVVKKAVIPCGSSTTILMVKAFGNDVVVMTDYMIIKIPAGDLSSEVDKKINYTIFPYDGYSCPGNTSLTITGNSIFALEPEGIHRYVIGKQITAETVYKGKHLYPIKDDLSFFVEINPSSSILIMQMDKNGFIKKSSCRELESLHIVLREDGYHDVDFAFWGDFFVVDDLAENIQYIFKLQKQGYELIRTFKFAAINKSFNSLFVSSESDGAAIYSMDKEYYFNASLHVTSAIIGGDNIFLIADSKIHIFNTRTHEMRNVDGLFHSTNDDSSIFYFMSSFFYKTGKYILGVDLNGFKKIVFEDKSSRPFHFKMYDNLIVLYYRNDFEKE